jgi:effector-binding domain-containing protein
MQVKAVKPISFIYFRTEAKIDELAGFLSISQELFREAVRYDLTITGPIHWHYFGFEGDANKSFTLEIGLPVGEVPEGYDGKFHFKRTEPFKCVSAVHEGNWLDMPVSYAKLMGYIAEHNLKPLAINREIYVNADFRHPEANVTEIQIGIN